jgi:hypothetical protein
MLMAMPGILTGGSGHVLGARGASHRPGGTDAALTARLHTSCSRHPTGSIAAMHLGYVRYNTVIVPAVALLLYLAMGRRG